MYKIVETKEEFEIAKALHQQIFSGEGYIVEEMSPNNIQILFYEGDVPVGLMELIPYNPSVFTTVENEFAFSELEDIQKNQSTTFEVDKLGFIPEIRGKGYFKSVIECLVSFAALRGVTRYIALLDALVYRMSQIAYRDYHIKKVGKSFVVNGERRKSVPVVIDAEKVLQKQTEKRKTSKV